MPILNDVFIERGAKRVFAGAIEWPGWCRSGRTEEAALEALLAYGPRYAKALGRRRLGFMAPADVVDLRVVERRTGNATTDFGAPAIAPQADERPIDAKEAKRLAVILEACWAALDRAAAAADGHVLRTGPRGGGRQLAKIVAHVADAEGAYRSKLGALPAEGDARAATLAAFASRARGEPPERIPRSGVLWSPRYFIRRAAWHVLDHAWEIEDRSRPAS